MNEHCHLPRSQIRNLTKVFSYQLYVIVRLHLTLCTTQLTRLFQANEISNETSKDPALSSHYLVCTSEWSLKTIQLPFRISTWGLTWRHEWRQVTYIRRKAWARIPAPTHRWLSYQRSVVGCLLEAHVITSCDLDPHNSRQNKAG